MSLPAPTHAALPASPSRADSSPRSNGFWGMAVFLITDSVMFILLLVANIYLRRYAPGQPQHYLDVSTTLWYSAGLWASSATLVLAERLQRRALLSGLLYLLTGGLGLLFMYGQAQEYLRLAHEKVSVNSDLFFTGFYTVTGLHGLHVLLGALLWLFLGVVRLRGQLGPRRRGISSALGLYWHFVDAVWVILFLVLYIWRGP